MQIFLWTVNPSNTLHFFRKADEMLNKRLHGVTAARGTEASLALHIWDPLVPQYESVALGQTVEVKKKEID